MPAWKAWERGIKRELLIWHRRAGKDEIALHKAAVAAHERPATYWHMLPEYSQARKAIWNAVNPHTGLRRIDEAFPKELRASTNESEMFIRFKVGSTWQVVGSDNYDALVGTPPAGVVFSEFALSNPSSWGYLSPILAENGGWASFITTPRGRNHVYKMLQARKDDPKWFVQKLTVDDTHAITREQIEEQRADYHALFGIDAGDALIEQEYWCSFDAPILGAYWAREIDVMERSGRVCAVPHEPKLPVHTVWDIGVGDATAIWFFQVFASEVRIIDWHEADGMAVDYYVEMLKEKRETLGYEYGNDYVPHDAKVREFTNAGPGNLAKTRIETMIELGRHPVLVPNHRREDGVNAARRIFARCWFDEVRTARGLELIRQYHKEWDDKEKVFKDIPKHDFTSHSADAWRYLAMAYEELRAKPAPPPQARPLMVGPENMATLDDMWASTPKRSSRL